MRKSGRDKILIITQYNLPEYKRNMNAYQRNFCGSNYADIHLLIRRKHEVSRQIHQRVKVHKAPVENRLFFFCYAICFGLIIRFRGVAIVLTEPSRFAFVGFVLKLLAGYFWVMDVWDRPLWRGRHEAHHRIKTSDKLTFWIMGHADLFILSCLPRAAKDIRLHPDRCVQLFNAIDLSVMADGPPPRSEDDPTLHLALARSKIGRREGFLVVLRAAEKIKERKAHIKIHLIGYLDDDASQLLVNSSASDLFLIHGFITQSRCDFFRSVHAGLVPYLDLEDMSYIFPIKVLEHLSQGNVVIASNVPGLATMIRHEQNGLLFESADSDDLARNILRLYEDVDLWRKLSANAIESVKKYDPEIKNQIIFSEISNRRVLALGKAREKQHHSRHEYSDPPVKADRHRFVTQEK